jgi:transmembrane protein DUF3566
VTPADNTGRTGEAPERAADRPTSLDAGEQPAPEGQLAGNGMTEPSRPGLSPVSSEDLELSHGTPPPWQRVTADTPVSTPDPGQQTMPATPTSSPDEQTVRVERPVVTGTAASRLGGLSYGDGLGTPARTTVHLENTSNNPSATGPLRTAGTSPPSALRRPGRGPRRANLQIKRFDPWSVLKLSLVLGVALFFVWLVAVGVLYAVLDGMGVWDKLNGISSEILQSSEDAASGDPLISAGRVFGVAAIIGAVNIVLFSALSTVGAFIYNVSADLAGGLEVTLAERE